MSSILKALKKLEEENPSRGDEIAWSRKLGPARIIRRWEIHSGRFAMILWGSLGLILLAAAGWFILYARQPLSADAVPAATIPESVPVKSAPLPEFLRKPREPMQAANLNPSRTRAAGEPSAQVRKRAAKSAVAASEARPSSADRSSAKSKAKQRAAQTATKPAAVPAGLTLQAISWSQQAMERIAVINGQIVREGHALEGFVITRIEPDRVFLRKGGEELSLAFDLQRSLQ